MKYLLRIVGLLIAISAQATTCPSAAWGAVWTPANGALPPSNQDYNGIVYSPNTNKVYVYANAAAWVTPWENAIVSYSAQANCGQASNPWAIVSDSGIRNITYPTYTTNATLGGISSCNGASVASGSSTVAMNLVGNTLNACPQGSNNCLTTAGGWALDKEVVEYTSISSGAGTACVVYTGLTWHTRGTSAATHIASVAPGSSGSYAPPTAPTAAQVLANSGATGGMKADVGSGLVATQDHPTDRHPSRVITYDTLMHRLWQTGGYYEVKSFGDTFSWCLPGVGTTTDCPNGNSSTPGSILYGWTRQSPTTGYTPHQLASSAYDSDHDAIYQYGGSTGGAVNDMWVMCLHITGSSPATCGGVALTWVHLTPSCSGTCPARRNHQMVYDSDDHILLVFGGGDATAGNTNILTYAPTATNTLSQAANSWVSRSSPPGVTSSTCCNLPAFDYDTTRHIAIFHYDTGTLFKYAPTTDTWTNTGITGGPPTSPGTIIVDRLLAYDSVDDIHIFVINTNSAMTTWQLPGAAISSPAVTIYPRITRGTTTRR